MATVITFDALDEQYQQLWDSMRVRPEKAADIDATAQRILAKKTRYQAVEHETHVPWFMIGVIHALECGLRFDRHLHCGDPLTKRTVHDPKGRPKAAPANGSAYTWEESAIDALTYPPHQLNKVADWSIERIAYELELYNGSGYRRFHPETLTPYLWSGSNHYTRGKYVADGKWSATAVSGQSGAMPLIKRLAELDAEVAAAVAAKGPEPAPVETLDEHHDDAPALDPSLEFPKTDGAPIAEAPAPTASPATLAHMEAHAELIDSSFWYNLRRGLLKSLGIGAGTGSIGIFTRAQEDPVGTVDTLLNFAKAHSLALMGIVLAVVVVLELIQFATRQQVIAKEAGGAS